MAETPQKPIREKLTSPIILGQIALVSAETQTTVGSPGSASALPANPTGYLKLIIGDTEYAIPYYDVA